MKTLAVLLAIVGVAALAIPHVSSQDATRDGVFVHISHGPDDPHRLLMALNMASIMADDHDVLVYLDIKGVHAVLKDSEDIAFSHFPSSKTQLATLLEKKVTVMACPGCLKAAEKTKDDLAEGIQVADKKAFFNFTKGRILTLDY
jgi:predicted peroxiredoxin